MNPKYQIKLSRILSRLLEVAGMAGKPLDDLARMEAPGSFITLAKGKVHYETAGPGNGVPLVLVHGLSVPGYIWDPIFHPLARAGFRVIRFDLYGRGFSDKPKVRYDVAVFDTQRILAGLYDDFYTKLRPKGYETKMIQQISYSGFRRALLSTLRNGVLHEMEPIYRSLGKTNLKMMLVWGKEDRVIPHENCIRLRGLIPDMVCHFIEKTGHLPHYEDPEQVLPLLVEFFNP